MTVRGGSRTNATSKMERFVIIINGFHLLIIITKLSILDVAAVLDVPLDSILFCKLFETVTIVHCKLSNSWYKFCHQVKIFRTRNLDFSTNVGFQEVSVLGDFLVRIFPHLDWIRRDTSYISVFTPNTGKYGPENLRIRTLFTKCLFYISAKKLLQFVRVNNT